MHQFFMFGNYKTGAVKDISANRTDKCVELVEELGGKVISMYALLGSYDLVMITQFDKLETAMKASLGMTCFTGVSFTTHPAVPIEDFDKMLWEGPSFYKG